MPNLSMPGNPRYQPKDLIPIFGYDNLARPIVEVELAAMKTLAEMGMIPAGDMEQLTPDIEEKLLSIPMTEVDRVEREVTKHDIRALVRLMQEILPEPLRRWVHIPLTSYDALEPARILMFKRAHTQVVRPKVRAVMESLGKSAHAYANIPQIGRTHGQHALPITVGFWMATILSRMLNALKQMDYYADNLRGKISGAVGAYNAQAAIGLEDTGTPGEFERRVLRHLGLEPAPISTQILPPEPLANYLWSCALMSAALGQFGLDARHLMRTEIGELAEPFEKGQVGSSTMAHKRNPLNFENEEGMWEGVKAEMGKVFSLLLSEHQRDLVGSSVARDLPTIVVKLVYQLDTLLRAGKEDKRPFIERIVPDEEACRRNLNMQGGLVLAEPLYIALQMAGYPGDAHELVNHKLVEMVRNGSSRSLMLAVHALSKTDPELKEAWANVPTELKQIMTDPAKYTGLAAQKTYEICNDAYNYFYG